MMLRPPCSTLFPYTTLFRSCRGALTVRKREIAKRNPRGFEIWDWRWPIWGLRTAEFAGGDWHRWIFAKRDRKSTRLNSSHVKISYAVFCLKKKKSTVVKIEH